MYFGTGLSFLSTFGEECTDLFRAFKALVGIQGIWDLSFFKKVDNKLAVFNDAAPSKFPGKCLSIQARSYGHVVWAPNS